MRSRNRLGAFLPAVLLFAACPTRTIYYPDAGTGGAAGSAGRGGGSGGLAGASGMGGAAGAPGPGGSAGTPFGGAGGEAGRTDCNATSCPNGCCSTAGACVPYASETNDACGTAGEACSPCPTGSSCAPGAGICLGCTSGTVTTEASLGMAGGGNDRFGTSVAVRNGVMIAAAPNALSGIGRLFALSGSGTSYAFVQFVAPASGAVSAYAQPIGIDRMGTALVAGGSSNGIATDWTFNRTGANWFSGFSVAPPATNISMGGVAIDAGTVVVGGLYAAYVYSTSGGGPQTLTPSDFTPGSTSGYFGAPSAISGDSLLIGGEPEDGAGNFGHFGYVFVRSGSTWVDKRS